MMSNDRLTGMIIKGIGGFYYVEAADAVYECKARGVFRKRGMSPCAGDQVEISLSADGTGAI
ncbi:MAG: ribosome biogenesis GTPase RsgA, partial [Clostridium sp.]